jgi:CubicO group peptidase (beta-lactamase class C family)
VFPLSSLQGRLEERLREALPGHQVPGAVLGLATVDETAVAAAGIASRLTGAPVRPDSLFAIGSVTKVYEAALVLSLGLDLDEPVRRRHLPGFRVADAEATETITLRHLLTHSSGLEGDYLADFGRGDDVVRRYVESCASLGQLHPPGLLTSYCNSGCVVGGRAVELATHLDWDSALRERLLEPAGLTDTVSLPEDAILRPVAVGHLPGEGGPVVTPEWSWGRSFGPAGGTPAASAPDVLAFARLHLDGGGALGSEIPAAMAGWQRAWPEGIEPGLAGMGLGWLIWDWCGTRVLGHDGSGVGCFASLRLVPDRGIAVVVLTNYEVGGMDLADELIRGVLADEAGLSPPPRLAPIERAEVPEASRYTGTYKRLNTAYEIVERPGSGLAARVSMEAMGVVVPDDVAERSLEPAGDDLFAMRHALVPTDVAIRFVDADGDGELDYLYDNKWANRRL